MLYSTGHTTGLAIVRYLRCLAHCEFEQIIGSLNAAFAEMGQAVIYSEHSGVLFNAQLIKAQSKTFNSTKLYGSFNC
jgi:hypothetical protein